VAIGAHVSYRDRQGFGRREVEVPTAQLLADLGQQYAILAEEVEMVGGTVAYVKPHGALYNRMGVDDQVAAAVVEAVRRSGSRVLVAQPGTPVVDLARNAGLVVATEAFPDRGYLPDGRLAPRQMPGSLVTDPVAVRRRAVSLATRGGVEATDGRWVTVSAASLCVHGDTPEAAEAARHVRQALEAANVTLRSFAGPTATGPTATGPTGP
jgi:UPF0271 protein